MSHGLSSYELELMMLTTLFKFANTKPNELVLFHKQDPGI
jgi:hypothetical protein